MTRLILLTAAVALVGNAESGSSCGDTVAAAQRFRDHFASERWEDARAMVTEDPRRWFEERAGEGAPFGVGPGPTGPWAAWDDHFGTRREEVEWSRGDCSASLLVRETNDYFLALDRGWVTNRITYFFDRAGHIEGVLIQGVGARPPGRTEEFLAWAREHEPEELAELMPGGEIDPGDDHPRRFRALLERWRTAAGLGPIPAQDFSRGLDWTIGSWRGFRSDGVEGSRAPMKLRVEPILGGAGQALHFEVEHGEETYRGFAVQVPGPDAGRWVRQYTNAARGSFSALEGQIEGEERSVWTSMAPSGSRRSSMVSERLGPGAWRRTMSISEDGGASWRVLWIDELTRVPAPGDASGTPPRPAESVRPGVVTHAEGVSADPGVDGIYQAFHEAYRELDAGAVAATYDDDASYLAPGAELRRGRAEVKKGFERLFGWARENGARLEITFEIVERRLAAELGYDVGYFDFKTHREDGSTEVNRGKFVVVLRSGEDGWRIVVDSFSPVRQSALP